MREGARRGIRVITDQGQGYGALGDARPGQRRRNVLALARVAGRDRLAVAEGIAPQLEFRHRGPLYPLSLGEFERQTVMRRRTSKAGVPLRGERVTFRRTIGSGRDVAGRSSARCSTVRSTTRISNSAKAAPMQRRVPPPNGIQPYVSGPSSRKRSGRNAWGSG